MCLYPTLVKNRKYTKTKKNGGVVPAPPLHISKGSGREVYDERVLLVPIGCGKCMECRNQKKREWTVRMMEEIKHSRDGIMVTLTFSTESYKELNDEIDVNLTGYERDNQIATLAVRRFLERWRKKFGKSVRHFLVTELGGEGYECIHMHGILFTKESKETIRNIWKYGICQIGGRKEEDRGYVTEKTVNYIVKYITKTDILHKEYKQKVLCSPGIGKQYVESAEIVWNKYKKGSTNESYRLRNGDRIALPIYYRNKIYSEQERELLWLEKLDSETRYVNGNKISIKNGEENYYKALMQARKKNTRLGYGNNKINWNRRRYENQRRTLIVKKRIEDNERKNYVPF